MTPRDVFGIIVRTVGLGFVAYSFEYLQAPLGMALYPAAADASLSTYMVYGVIYFLIGAYLLRGAPHLVRFAYPPDRP